MGLLFVCLLGLCPLAFGQQGTAANGYYPPGYSGDTWTGVVASSNEQTQEITLSYTNPKNGKAETFIGIPEQGYLVHEHGGATRPLKLSDIPVGRTIKVWYKTATKMVNGKKVKFNSVFQISTAANANMGRVSFMAF